MSCSYHESCYHRSPAMADPTEKEDTFAALFESQSNKGKIRRNLPRVGETLEAVVVQIGRDTVFVELDGKRQAQLDIGELRGPDGNVTVSVGELVKAHVVSVDPGTGDVRLARSVGRIVTVWQRAASKSGLWSGQASAGGSAARSGSHDD